MMNDISNLKNRFSISNAGDKYIVALQNENEKLKSEMNFSLRDLNNIQNFINKNPLKMLTSFSYIVYPA